MDLTEFFYVNSDMDMTTFLGWLREIWLTLLGW